MRDVGSRALTAWFLGLLGLVAPVAAPAARADDLAWKLALGETLRYDAKADALPPEAAGESGYAPRLDPVRLVRADDLERGRRWKHDVTGIAEAAWFYALSLPPGASDAKRGVFAIDDKHARAALTARGTDEVTITDGRATVKAMLALTTEPPPKPDGTGIAAGTTLIVIRTFDVATKRLVEASYALDAKQLVAGKPHEWRIAGRITGGAVVDDGSRAFLSAVDEAIKRGRGRLRGLLDEKIAQFRKPPPQGALAHSQALGHVALGTFALLRSGVPADDLKDAFAFMETCPFAEVYSVSLYLMCLEAKHIRRESVPPVDGGRTVARFGREPIPEADKALLSKAAEWLVKARQRGAWTYTPMKAGDQGGDRSNSQFAALALHVALVNGVKLDPAVFQEMADEIVNAQEQKGPGRTLAGCTFTAAAPKGLRPAPKGGGTSLRESPTPAQERGWGYGMNERCQDGKAYGSMTGAGVSSAIAAREALRRAGRLDGATEEKTRKAILDGIAWLAARFTPVRNPGNQGFVTCFYWLYSLEKAMEMAGCESLAGHDWWHEGAANLLAIEEGGGWGSPGWANLEDTSLALLFLNRATLPARIGVEARPTVTSGKDDPSSWDLVEVPGTGFVHVAQVLGALTDASPDEVKDVLKVAEKAFQETPEEVRPRLVPALVRVVLGEQAAPKAFAKKALRQATGTTDDPAKALAFHDRWQAAVRAGERMNHGAIADLREAIAAKDAQGPLRRAALTSLAKLRAVEAIPDLLDQLALGDAAARMETYTALVSIAGGPVRPYDPEAPAPERAKAVDAWRAWWKDEGPAITAQEKGRRAGPSK